MNIDNKDTYREKLSIENEIKILVAADDTEIADLVVKYLEVEGYKVDKAYNGFDALNLFKKKPYDIVITDIMMPRIDGLELIKQIRELANPIIILLTAKDKEIDRVIGLKSGADDYIVKPFFMNELVARVQSHLRRYNQDNPKTQTKLVFNNLIIDLNVERLSGEKTDFHGYMTQTNLLIVVIIGILLYSLFTTYIFEREFKDNMYKHLFTVPVSKFNLLISKLIVIMIGLLVLTLTSYVFGMIFSFISGFSNMNSANILDTIMLYLKSYLTFIPLMIPVILITLIFKSFVAPIAFSIIVEIILVIVMSSKYIALFPWTSPILFGTDLLDSRMEAGVEIIGNIYYNLYSIIILGIISFIGCLIYLNRKEVA